MTMDTPESRQCLLYMKFMDGHETESGPYSMPEAMLFMEAMWHDNDMGKENDKYYSLREVTKNRGGLMKAEIRHSDNIADLIDPDVENKLIWKNGWMEDEGFVLLNKMIADIKRCIHAVHVGSVGMSDDTVWVKKIIDGYPTSDQTDAVWFHAMSFIHDQATASYEHMQETLEHLDNIIQAKNRNWRADV